MSDIDVGQISEALNNKVDLDCDNINTDGEKHFDGQWVYTSVQLASGVSWTGSSQTYDLSAYLPDDDYNYECVFDVYATATTTLKKFMTVALSSDLTEGHRINICTARCNNTSVSNDASGNIVLSVGTGRTITQYSSTSDNAGGTYNLSLMAYRRIGVNQ